MSKQKEQISVGIVVPVFNVEKYIAQCLDSIINQTYQNIEIIIIDDGSTDNSGKICDDFAQNDHRIKVIHKDNGGIMSAWIEGVKIIKSDFVYFVDSDDWIENNTILVLVDKLIETKADIIIHNYLLVGTEQSIKVKHLSDCGFYNKEDVKKKILPTLLNNGTYLGRSLYLSRWGKLIKKELILNNIKYCKNEISYGDDLNIIFPVIIDCDNLAIIVDYLYNYRFNTNSFINTYIKNMNKQIDSLFDVFVKIAKDKKAKDLTMSIHNNYYCMIIASVKNEIRILNSLKDFIKYIQKITLKLNNNSYTKVKLNIIDKIILKMILRKNIVLMILIFVLYKMRLFCLGKYRVLFE